MNQPKLKCPLCFNKEDLKYSEQGFSCPFCGMFYIDNSITEDFLINCPEDFDDNWRLKTRYTVKKYEIEQHIKPHIKKLPLVLTQNKLKEINESFPLPQLIEKIDLFLEYLGNKTTFISEEIVINANNLFTLFFCKNNYELEQIIQYSLQNDLIKSKYNSGYESKRIFEGNLDDFECNNYKYNYYPIRKCYTAQNSTNGYVEVKVQPTYSLILTTKGLTYLSEKKKNNINSKQCFVAMWFNTEENKTKHRPNMEQVYLQAIKPAIEDNEKFFAVKIDCIDYCNDINDEMITQIRRSRFMIADLTGYRGGVYWEAGFAYGLGIPVIYTCNKNWLKTNNDLDIEGIHFDLNHQNIILWDDDLDDFKKKLTSRISAIIV